MDTTCSVAPRLRLPDRFLQPPCYAGIRIDELSLTAKLMKFIIFVEISDYL